MNHLLTTLLILGLCLAIAFVIVNLIFSLAQIPKLKMEQLKLYENISMYCASLPDCQSFKCFSLISFNKLDRIELLLREQNCLIERGQNENKSTN